MTNEGFFGIPIHVSANYLVLFILFGALAEKSGLGKLIIDLSLLVIYKFTGGSAKISCVASGLFGSISGSSVANVMTTGIFTIPLMKKIIILKVFQKVLNRLPQLVDNYFHPLWGRLHLLWLNF